MSDESVTREALRWALGRTCADADVLLHAAQAWLDGDWQECACWLLNDAVRAGVGLRCPAAMAAALLRIASLGARGQDAWLAGLPAADATAVREALEGEG